MNINRRLARFFFLSLLIILFFAYNESYAQTNNVTAEKGVLDLRDWDFAKQGLVVIEGEWAFYPNEWINPARTSQPERYLSPETVWGEEDAPDLPRQGYGSYQLIIKLPEDAARAPLGFSLGSKHLAYELYVNGQLEIKNGQPGTTKQDTQLLDKKQVSYINSQDDTLNVTIHIANFEYPETSLDSTSAKAISFGTAIKISQSHAIEFINSSIALTVFFTVGLYYLLLFSLRKKRYDILFFALTCLSYGVLIAGQGVDFALFSKISWRFDYIATEVFGFAIVLFFYMYIKATFPREFSGFIYNTVIWGYVLCIVAMILLPLAWIWSFLHTMNILSVFDIFAFSLLLVGITRAVLNKRDGANILVFGAGIGVAGGILPKAASLLVNGNDFFTVYGNFFLRYGLIGYVASLAFLLAKRSSKTEGELVERNQALEVASNEIKNLNERLEQDNMRMGSELDITRRLQNMLLPNRSELAVFPHLDIAATMLPAEEVGGDYYDVLFKDIPLTSQKQADISTLSQQGSDNITIGIGDITGHGLESGMVMLMTQMGVRTLLETGMTDIEQVLTLLNRSLHKNIARMGADKTLSLGLLNYSYAEGTGHVRYCGQHETLLVVRADGQVETYDTIDLGFPIALEADISPWVSSLELSLQQGDGIVLYSDGIVEAENDTNELYGLPRLLQCLRNNWQDYSARQVKLAIIREINNFIGKNDIYDDITLIVVKQC